MGVVECFGGCDRRSVDRGPGERVPIGRDPGAPGLGRTEDLGRPVPQGRVALERRCGEQVGGGRRAGGELGLGIGIVGSLVLTRFMEAQLFNVKSGDPVTLIAVVAVLGIVAMVACWLPARRAAKTSPIEALRYE